MRHGNPSAGWFLGVAAALLITALAIGVIGPGRTPTAIHRTRPSSLTGLPSAPAGFRVPPPRGIGDRRTAAWAPVLSAAMAHRAPSRSSPVVGRIDSNTPEGTTNIVVENAVRLRAGVTWVRTRLAALPNGQLGWIPRDALGGWHFVTTRLIVDLERQTLTLDRDGRMIFHAPIGVGATATPTPRGVFAVRDRLTKYASPEYGPVAFGTSARSPDVTDWPAGGFIGIHGTDEPQLIPGRVSHGCIRLRNRDIRALARLLPVGTPVIIR